LLSRGYIDPRYNQSDPQIFSLRKLQPRSIDGVQTQVGAVRKK
jgi:hypothetical protein